MSRRSVATLLLAGALLGHGAAGGVRVALALLTDTESSAATFASGAWGPNFLRPNGDVTSQFYASNTGATTNLFTFINEQPASDVTYIQNSTGAAGTGRIYEAALTNVADPGVDTGHVIRFRARYTIVAAGTNLRVDLYQGPTLIATAWNAPVSGAAFTPYSYTLTGAQAAAITNYDALTIRITPTNDATVGARHRVSWIELEVP